MHALFVHGMGRTPVSGWPMLRYLRRAGLETEVFGYMTSLEDFAKITRRLAARLTRMASRGDYVLIGHSLGGILLRAAVNRLPPGTRLPLHLFLLGSPVRPARLAQTLRSNPFYRMLARDCGQVLASAERMKEVGPVSVPTTSIAGTRGMPWPRNPFPDEPNDGVVALSEVDGEWISDRVRIHMIHTLLPASKIVAGIVLARLAPDKPLRPQ